MGNIHVWDLNWSSLQLALGKLRADIALIHLLRGGVCL